MRRLAQPSVVTSAAVAAAATALLSLPRMLLWAKIPFPVWYAEATLFLGGFVLWAFVFAWHTEYTGRPLFTLRIKTVHLALATLAGLCAATLLHFFLDPTARLITPEDYPPDVEHWIALTLFALAFTQLFLLYAPFAWLARLFRNEKAATWLTVLVGVGVLVLKTDASPKPVPASMLLELLVMRIGFGFAAIWIYLRGGILLVSWAGFLVEARHLLEFSAR
jgi:hypothetical protein